MKKLIFLWVLLSSVGLSAQTLKQYENKAQEALEDQDWSAALSYYQVLLELDSTRVDALYPAAESAQQLKAYPLANQYYDRIPVAERTGAYALTDLKQARARRSLEDYDGAVVLYQRYLENSSAADATYRTQAQNELAYSEWALDMMANTKQVEVEQLGEEVNTTYSEAGG